MKRIRIIHPKYTNSCCDRWWYRCHHRPNFGGHDVDYDSIMSNATWMIARNNFRTSFFSTTVHRNGMMMMMTCRDRNHPCLQRLKPHSPSIQLQQLRPPPRYLSQQSRSWFTSSSFYDSTTRITTSTNNNNNNIHAAHFTTGTSLENSSPGNNNNNESIHHETDRPIHHYHHGENDTIDRMMMQDYDIVVVGGGVVGATLVDQIIQQQQQQQIHHHRPFLKIAMIESSQGPSLVPPNVAVAPPPSSSTHITEQQQPPATNADANMKSSTFSSSSSSTTTTHTTMLRSNPIPHPRSYALSPASIQLLFGMNNTNTADHTKNYGVDSISKNIYDVLGNDERGYYTRMQVWEAQQPASLIWTTNDLLSKVEKEHNNNRINNHHQENDTPMLGWCMEDWKLQQYLWYHQLQYPHDRSHDERTKPYHNPRTNVTIYRSTTVSDIEWPNNENNSNNININNSNNTNSKNHTSWVTGTLSTSSSTATTPNTTTTTPFRTRLLIAADGNQSKIRQWSGIEMEQYWYGQTALTFTVQYPTTMTQTNDAITAINPTNPRHRCAYQRYLPNGSVLALLPTYDISNYGIIVYSTSTEEAQYWKDHAFSTTPNKDSTTQNDNATTGNSTGQQDLVNYLNKMLQTGPERLPSWSSSISKNSDHDPSIVGNIVNNIMYGIEQVVNTVQYGMSMAAQQPTIMDDSNDPATFQAPPRIGQIVSSPFMFPLSCQIPKHQQYTRSTYLALVGDAAHTVHPMAGQGLNLGLQDVVALRDVIMKATNSGMDVGTYLHEYNTSRQLQVSTTVAGIHGLQQLLCQRPFNGILMKHVKAFGMNCIQNIKPLRQTIVRAACYGV